MSCPEIDVLLSTSGRRAAAAHLEGCSACAAIASLADVRQDRVDGHDDDCALAEVRIAAWQAGTIASEDQRELVAHLETCEACNDVAVRVRSLPVFTEEAAAQPPAAPAWREVTRTGRGKALLALALGSGLAAAAVVAMSLGVRMEPKLETLTPELPAGSAQRPAGARAVDSDPSPALVPPMVAPSGTPPTSGTGDTGYITLICEPGCQIFDGGRHVGDSPLLRYPVPAEPHVLVARYGDQERRVGVRVEAGFTVTRRVVMDSGASEVVDPWKSPGPAGSSSEPSGDIVNPFSGPKGVGYLTLLCVPGCDDVRVGSLDLGPSPIVRHGLAAGTHSVTLRRGGAVKRRSIRIAEREVTALRVDMSDAAVPKQPAAPKPSDELIDPFR